MGFTDEDWERAGGVLCESCGREVLRYFRVCSSCLAKARGPAQPTEIVLPFEFTSGEWELVEVYEFNRRISYIFRHCETGDEIAHDILKTSQEVKGGSN